MFIWLVLSLAAVGITIIPMLNEDNIKQVTWRVDGLFILSLTSVVINIGITVMTNIKG